MNTVLFLIVFFGFIIGLSIAVALAFQDFVDAKLHQYELQDAFSRAEYKRRNVGSGFTKEEADEARQQAERLLRADFTR